MSANSYEVMQAIRGPILLITLGTLVAIDYFGPYRFSRTWPILIIVFGILKLLERLGARPTQQQQQYDQTAGSGDHVI